MESESLHLWLPLVEIKRNSYDLILVLKFEGGVTGSRSEAGFRLQFSTLQSPSLCEP